MKLIRKAIAIFDRVRDLAGALSLIILCFVWVTICVNVFMRYFLNRSITWGMEIAEYSLLYLTFLAAAWLLKEEGHVHIELVLDRLKPRTQSLLNTITSIIGAVLCLVIAWYSAETTWEYFQRGVCRPTPLEPPTFLILAVIPVGSFLLFFQFLRRAYGHLKSRRASLSKEQRT